MPLECIDLYANLVFNNCLPKSDSEITWLIYINGGAKRMKPGMIMVEVPWEFNYVVGYKVIAKPDIVEIRKHVTIEMLQNLCTGCISKSRISIAIYD